MARATLARLGVAALAALAGCAELPDVEPGICGNGVLEPAADEECDGVAGCGPAGDSNACLRVCSDPDVACPAGWACGSDLRCRPPTESFMASATQAAGSTSVSARDMDGDGAADLLGYDARGLLMRWGDWDGALTGQTRVALPVSNEASAFLDADGNDLADLAVPLADLGLSLFVSDGARGLIPAAQTALALPAPADPADCAALVAGGLRSSLTAPKILLAIGGFSVGFIDFPDACDAAPLECIVSATGGELVGGGFAVADLGYGVTSGVHPGEQFVAATYGSNVVAVWGEATAAPRPERIEQWTTSVPIALDGHIWLAPINGDACIDLVVDTGSTLEIAYNQLLGPTCTGLADTLTRYDHPEGVVLAVGDVDDDGRAELLHTLELGPVTETTPVFALNPAAAPATTSRDVGLRVAGSPTDGEALDYNHDGWVDLVFTVEGADSVDFYLNYEGRGFNRFGVDVGGAARAPEVGDYDGDLHDDVAVVVTDTINPQGRDSLMIIYGDPGGRPSPAQFLGEFVTSARPRRFGGGLTAQTDSLLVTSNARPDGDGNGTCERRLAVLIGDTSRQMVSPFILLYDDPQGGPEPAYPLGLVDISSGGAPQVFAFGAVFPASGDAATATVISLLGFDGTAFRVDQQFAIPASQLPPLSLFNAVLRGGDLDGDGVPEVVGLAGDHAAVVSVPTRSAVISEISPALQTPPWLDLVDMDGDLDLDLVGAGGGAVVGAGGDTGAPASSFWIAWNDGGTLDFTAPTLLAMPAELYCFDADVIGSSPTGVPQLIASCYRIDEAAGLFEPVVAIASYVAARSTSEALDARIIRLDREPYGLEVADFTGDGLDDIAAFGATSVTLYRQCRNDEVGAELCQVPEALP